ncbi:MAG TPA: hypothetical protein VGK51_12080, partial [Actinomycetota bacterium]
MAACLPSPLALGARLHAQTPAGPQVVVSPSSDLHDQQEVHVVLSGFGQDDRVHLSECPTVSNVAVA